MIVGTAGHIDHGKTSLVKALTGVATDRLLEEKVRGITIDLGYAYKPLPDGDVLGFVDVPGHEKFIHNMLAGATGIDYVLLVVAADDGPMPQTLEHLAILELLGLKHGIVALTKIDRVDAARRKSALHEVGQMLARSSCSGFPVLPVSSITGEGLEALEATLIEAAGSLPARGQAHGHFRLAVDRSFTLPGIGTIVTGNVFAGRVAVGDRLMISPLNIEVRVRGLHAQNRVAQASDVGQRCALNLVAPQLDKHDITRGQWLLDSRLHAPTDRFDAHLTLLPGGGRPLRHWAPVHVHLGAKHVMGRVALLQGETLQAGNSVLVQILLDEAIGALHGDRFIVRDQSARRTLGGGCVLDAFPAARGRRKPERMALLHALEAPTPAAALQRLLDTQPGGVSLKRFAQLYNLRDRELEEIRRAVPLHTLHAGGDSPEGPTLTFSPAHWAKCVERLLGCLASFHQRYPDSAGANVDELRSTLPSRPPAATVSAMLDWLIAAQRVMRAGSRYLLPSHEVTLTASEQVLWERARPALAAARVAPPRLTELAQQLPADEDLLRQLFMKLARMGQLHAVRREVFFLPQTLALLAAQTEELALANPRGIVTVGPFRERTGLHRNLGIPVLEYFDRAGFTLRRDDGRRVRRGSALVFGGCAAMN